MSKNQFDNFDMTDPLGIWRAFRDTNMDAWAKAMANLVSTEAFAQSLGAYLDTYFATSAPMQRAVEQYMERSLSSLNMPSRVEVISLASRMTNIEMRLDDLEAKTDQILHALRAQPPVIVEMMEEHVSRAAATNGAANDENLETHLQALDEKTERLLKMVQTLQGVPQPPAKPAPPRTRKPKPPTPVDETPASPEDIAQDKGVEGFEEAAS
ncbi:MAG: hypothetical protein MI924_18830 [Chloroflexales bacterium]|nr:hypothetical protein [Chloroflexales bacterium]